MKTRNIAKYLGLLGVLGVLGFVTGNPGFYGFFGFFGFFGTLIGKGGDERVERNIDRACRNAFVFVTLMSAFSFAYVGVGVGSFNGVGAYPQLLALIFVGSMLLFAASYVYYDKKGEA